VSPERRFSGSQLHTQAVYFSSSLLLLSRCIIMQLLQTLLQLLPLHFGHSCGGLKNDDLAV
jgi:hypothetical protein